MKLKSFQFVYNHDEIYDWVCDNIFSTNTASHTKSLSLILPKQSISERRFSFGTSQDTPVEWLMKQIVVKCCAELWNISMLAKLNEHTAALSVSHTKIILEQIDKIRSSVYSNRFLNLLLNNRHWSVELMVESMCWSLGNATRDNALKKIHMRGSPFFLGVSLVKLSSYGNATKLDVSVHTLRTEYSSALTEFLLKLRMCYQQYGFSGKPKPRIMQDIEHHDASSDSVMPWILVNAKINDITVFLFNRHDACLLISLAETSLARTQQITVLEMHELHARIQNATTYKTNSLMNLADFTDIFINLKIVRIEYLLTRPKFPALNQFNIHIVNDSEAMWNANLHMHCLTLFHDMQDFRQKFWPASVHYSDGVPANSSDDDKTTVESPKTLLEIYAENTVVLGIKISERHSMQIFLGNLYMGFKEQSVISVEKFYINIDEMHIFTIKDFDMRSAASLDFLKAERKDYEHFELPTNKVWLTTIDTFSGIFPYDHDFAEAIQNEFNALIKWLKNVHGFQKKEFTSSSPLPSDMLIQIKEFLLEMSDDPFEVQLRDNYVLLVDEYLESVKREQTFEQKIQQLCADRLLLPAETLAELHASLVKKNSEIYIQRSKQIKESGPTRTRLIAWILTDLEIMALADPSLHGKDNVTRIMREIDAESPWPEEGLEFVTLWCRVVNVSCTEWKFMLR